MSVIYSSEYWFDVKRVADVIPNLNQLKNKKILITGATGMICSAVFEILIYLNRNYHFNISITLAGRSRERINDRFKLLNENEDYRFTFYDSTSYSFDYSEKVDFIIHGASPADPKSYGLYPVETMKSNIIGLDTLLKVNKKNTNCRLLYLSSSEIYGRKEDNDPYKESDYGYVDVLNPRACYPNAKRAAETLCASYYKEFGTDFVIVRPGHIYGPSITDKDSRASAQFTRKAKVGRNIILKSVGNQLRSYCYTLDCASAILTVLLNGICGNAYNISNPKSVISVRNLAELMAKIAGVNINYELPSDEEKSNYNLMENSSLDATKLIKLGWTGIFSPEEGVARTLNYIDLS